MKAVRSFKKRGTTECPIAVAYYYKGRYLPPDPHYHPEIEIAYVRQGHVICLVEDQEVHLSEGDILILSPEQTHWYQSPTQDAKILFFIFSLDAVALPLPHVFQKDFVQPLKEGLLELPQKLEPSHPAYAQAVSQMELRYAAFCSGPNYKFNRYNAVVNICLALYPWCKRREDAFPVKVDGNASVRYVIQHIHNWYFRPLTLKNIAEKVHLNPNYLSTLFHEKTGETVMQYLTRIRVDAAAYLLQNSELTVSQIAEKTGFQSESTFYQQFRKAMGISPREFRRAGRPAPTDSDVTNPR